MAAKAGVASKLATSYLEKELRPCLKELVKDFGARDEADLVAISGGAIEIGAFEVAQPALCALMDGNCALGNMRVGGARIELGDSGAGLHARVRIESVECDSAGLPWPGSVKEWDRAVAASR